MPSNRSCCRPLTASVRLSGENETVIGSKSFVHTAREVSVAAFQKAIRRPATWTRVCPFGEKAAGPPASADGTVRFAMRLHVGTSQTVRVPCWISAETSRLLSGEKATVLIQALLVDRIS